jgi:ribosomal protein S18 acetylase RimI-like enzyme
MEKKEEFAIRLANVDDTRQIARVQHVTWLATYPNEEHGITVADIEWKNFEGPERLARWERRLRECGESSNVWVATNKKREVLGFCWSEKSDHLAEIRAMYVLPEYQGMGIGYQLIAKALAWLGSDVSVSVGVASYNTKAIVFYEKQGFRNEGLASPFAGRLPSGKVIPEIRLVKVAAEFKS